MMDSHIRNSKALDNLITNSTTGSIPYELLDSGLLPISLMGVDDLIEVEEEPKEEEKIPMGLQKKNNVIQFKRKNDEDK